MVLLLLPAQGAAQQGRGPQQDSNQRLDRIEQLLGSNALLGMLQQLQALEDQLKQLQGQLELQGHGLEQIKKKQRSLYVDLDQRLQRMERGDASATEITAPAPETQTPPPLATLSPLAADQPQAPPATAGLTLEIVDNAQAVSPATAPANDNSNNEDDQQTAAEAEDITAPAVDPVKARADYQNAFRLLNDQRYDQAIKAFAAFMQSHPASVLADKAQYWLAETYFVTSAYPQALAEYAKLINQYPDSRKQAQARLKIAYAHQELGQLDAARQALTGLVDDYPGTTVARLAGERLQQLELAAQADAGQAAPPD